MADTNQSKKMLVFYLNSSGYLRFSNDWTECVIWANGVKPWTTHRADQCCIRSQNVTSYPKPVNVWECVYVGVWVRVRVWLYCVCVGMCMYLCLCVRVCVCVGMWVCVYGWPTTIAAKVGESVHIFRYLELFHTAVNIISSDFNKAWASSISRELFWALPIQFDSWGPTFHGYGYC